MKTAFVTAAWVISLPAALIAADPAPSIQLQNLLPEGRVKLYAWIEAGYTYNPDRPQDKRNLGHLFDERSNEFL